MSEGGRRIVGVSVAVVTPGSILYTIATPNLTVLQQDYSATPTAAAWLVTVFLITSAVSALAAGPLVARFGARRAVIVIILTVAAGGLLASLSPHIGGAIAGRALQGVSGASIPIALTVVRHSLTGPSQFRALAMISTWGAVGGGIGLVIGGPIVHLLGARSVFWLPALALAALLPAVRVIPGVGRLEGARNDWGGILLIAGAAAAGLAVIGGARTTLPLPVSIVLGVAAIVLAGWWWRHERGLETPAVDLRLLTLPGMPLLLIVNAVAGAAMIARLATLPGYLQTPRVDGGLGLDATISGFVMVPTSLGILLGGWLTGLIGERVQPGVTLTIGLAVLACGMGFFVVAHDGPNLIGVASAINGIGIGAVFAATTPLALRGVSLAATTTALGIVAITRATGSAAGPQVAIGVLAGQGGYPLGLAPESHLLIAGSAAIVVALAAIAVATSRALRGPTRTDGSPPEPIEPDGAR